MAAADLLSSPPLHPCLPLSQLALVLLALHLASIFLFAHFRWCRHSGGLVGVFRSRGVDVPPPLCCGGWRERPVGFLACNFPALGLPTKSGNPASNVPRSIFSPEESYAKASIRPFPTRIYICLISATRDCGGGYGKSGQEGLQEGLLGVCKQKRRSGPMEPVC